MQGVTELMEHGSHLVPRQQRRHTIGSLGVVAYIKDNRYLVALTALLLETVHPGSSALRRTAVVVATEQGQRLTILVDDFEGLHIRMIEGNVLALLERQTIDTVGGIEDSIDKHAVDIEVGFHLVVGDIQEFLLHLCRVVETVVRLQLEVRACGLAGKVLDGLRLGIGLRRILADEVLQEGIDIIRCLGHRPFQRVRSIVGITHNLCLFCPQPGHLADDGEGVVLACTVGTMDRSLKDLLAQIAVVEISQDSLLCRVYNDDGIGSLTASVLGIFLTLGDVGLAKSGEILLLVHPDDSIVSGGLQQVTPILLKLRNPQVDFFHTLHLVLRQQSTPTDKALIGLLQQFLVLSLKGIILFIIDLFDALEQLLVEHNFVRQVCQHRHHLLLNLTNLWCFIGTDQGKEHPTHTVEQFTALLKGQNGIFESRRLWISYNRSNLFPILQNGNLEGRQIVRGLNLAKVGGTER